LPERLGAFQVGDDATSDAHNVRRCSTEVVVSRSRSSPHFFEFHMVVLQQVRINKHTQLGCMTKGRHAAAGLDK